MRRGRDDDVLVCVRWIGAPTTVVALVVLVLNDHVWKQQWTSPVTGKLSDVAGLVVAPPLLALVLAACRLRRPVGSALLLAGLGFAVAKTTTVGADAVSGAWSLVTPSHVVADPTDLLALPALLLALHAARWARADPVAAQRRVRLAAGSLMVPFVVMGTAATSACKPHDVARSVVAVDGRLATDPLTSTGALLVNTEYGERVVRADLLEPMSTWDQGRLGGLGDREVRESCSAAVPDWCWRLGVTEVVQASTDGGQSWSGDYAPSGKQKNDAVAGLGEKCGERARFVANDIAVVDTTEGPVVAVAAGNAGVARRGAAGGWTLIPLPERGSGATVTTPSPAPGLPLPQQQLVPLDPPPPTPTRTPRPTPPTQPGQTRHASPPPTTI